MSWESKNKDLENQSDQSFHQGWDHTLNGRYGLNKKTKKCLLHGSNGRSKKTRRQQSE